MNHIQSPATDDSAIERDIQAKGKTAARITPADIEANIKSRHFFTASDGNRGAADRDAQDRLATTYAWQDQPSLGLLTFCVLELQNGFTVTGESACASPENFDAEIGRKIAFENAKQKIWPLMGYELKSRLAAESVPHANPSRPSIISPDAVIAPATDGVGFALFNVPRDAAT